MVSPPPHPTGSSAGGLEVALTRDTQRRGPLLLAPLAAVALQHRAVPLQALGREGVVADDDLGAELHEDRLDALGADRGELGRLAAVTECQRLDVLADQQSRRLGPVLVLEDRRDALADLVTEVLPGLGQVGVGDVGAAQLAPRVAGEVVQQSVVGERALVLRVVVPDGTLLGLASGVLDLGARAVLRHDGTPSCRVQVA